MSRVLVLLSSYNGEKYIEAQILSILNQSNVIVEIIIRDDGSTDGTLLILQKYSQYENISVIFGNNIGYTKSFLNLMQISLEYDFDLLSFSDQDDVWLEDKLSRAVSKIDKTDRNALYFSNLTYTDKELNVIGTKKYDKYIKSFGSSMVMSSVAGCTIVITKELLKLVFITNIEEFSSEVGHDGFLYRLCFLTNGEVIFDSNSYILFRRHDNNASNAKLSILADFSKFKNLLSKFNGSQSRLANLLMENYKGYANQENKKILALIIKNNKLKIIFSSKLRTGIKKIDLAVKAAVLLNRY